MLWTSKVRKINIDCHTVRILKSKYLNIVQTYSSLIKIKNVTQEQEDSTSKSSET